MYKSICQILMVAILLIPAQLFAQKYLGNQTLLSKKKIVNDDFFNQQLVRVLALPVTDFNVDFYYRVEEYDSRLTNKDLDRISQIVDQRIQIGMTELAQAIIQAIQSSGGLKPTPVPVPAPEIKPQPQPQPQPTPEVPDEVRNIFSSHCTLCHSGQNPKGNLDLETYTKIVGDNSVALNGVDRWVIFDVTHIGYMPKNASPLTDAQVEVLREWARRNI